MTVQDPDAPWGADPADRWVMLRAEYGCASLWHVDGSLDHAEGLPPLPVSLVEKIAAWAELYDDLDCANETFPRPFFWEEAPEAPVAAFNAEGRAIALALKAALPDDWTVVHEDVDAWRYRDEPRAHRQLWLPDEARRSRSSAVILTSAAGSII